MTVLRKSRLPLVKGIRRAIAAGVVMGLASWASAKALSIGDIAPDFTAPTSEGHDVNLYQWMWEHHGKYTLLFSHPYDFTPVCSTELAALANEVESLKARGVQVMVLSPNTVEDHQTWLKDISHLSGQERVDVPIVADVDLSVAKQYGMLPGDVDPDQVKSAKDTFTVRSVFVINNANKKIEAMHTYPMFVGRNFDEIKRVVDALLLVDEHDHRIATPANWRPGDVALVSPAVSTEEAQAHYGQVTIYDLPSAAEGKPDYVRAVQPEHRVVHKCPMQSVAETFEHDVEVVEHDLEHMATVTESLVDDVVKAVESDMAAVEHAVVKAEETAAAKVEEKTEAKAEEKVATKVATKPDEKAEAKAEEKASKRPRRITRVRDRQYH